MHVCDERSVFVRCHPRLLYGAQLSGAGHVCCLQVRLPVHPPGPLHGVVLEWTDNRGSSRNVGLEMVGANGNGARSQAGDRQG